MARRPGSSSTRPPAAGYAGTPLAAKLGIRPGTRLLALAAPAGYRRLLAPLPAGLVFVRRLSPATDLVHLFVRERAALGRELPRLRAQLRADAVLWVSWPKRAAGIATDVGEDAIRAVALPLGLVDVKVCAVDAVWSGLKLVIRRALR
jgi:hypothetical protein